MKNNLSIVYEKIKTNGWAFDLAWKIEKKFLHTNRLNTKNRRRGGLKSGY
ncbi:hypothetical protein [Anaerocolumna sp. MB42-C2]|nr:hypothetical protein [Anaerocolumna sp. MB42-C2]WMJ86427.1 hypothetical protein RBU59_20640 [Anaerocolumna sp. MB42-C2]